MVFKNGQFNIERSNFKQYSSFFSSWFTTMVETRWRWTITSFITAFIADWVFFGLIHWIIALTHGDLAEENLPFNKNSTHWTPCVKNIFGFTSTLLFSIEVHTTVAYGRRAITLECPQSIVTMCLQCIVSSIVQAFLVGILFAKLTRPKSRTQTILFSKQVAISLRNDKLCFIFRVGDMRTSRIINIKVSAFIIRLNINNEVLEDFGQIEMKVETDGCESTFFLWPLTVVHEIDASSPLYNISAADLLCGSIEILAVIEGVIESTGQPVQAKTSYTVKDIIWGNRFVPMVNDSSDVYKVDFSKLSDTIEVDTPLCSAREYEAITSLILNENQLN